MKSLKIVGLASLLLSAGLCTQAWATRALGTTVTGEVTASPSPTQIEVGHMAYRIQSNSPAQRAARSFFVGQVVDIVLTRAGDNGQPEVVSIVVHSGT